jgi:hypothetical protein
MCSSFRSILDHSLTLRYSELEILGMVWSCGWYHYLVPHSEKALTTMYSQGFLVLAKLGEYCQLIMILIYPDNHSGWNISV